ncbi:hypothetical protein B0T14DRAFT_587347 [Immersiella caudata]|uniref:Uncharacterized protein n=1 Tax=Immersiella caudata TaxID=314043 RepID=A0AA39WSL3_9PEZI|nr:hypothetical protein B0T14DRAFT_587347 [Immersiella caudata]
MSNNVQNGLLEERARRVAQVCKEVVKTAKSCHSHANSPKAVLRLVTIRVSTAEAVFESLCSALQSATSNGDDDFRAIGGQEGALESCLKALTELESLLDSNWQATVGSGKCQKTNATAASNKQHVLSARIGELVREVTQQSDQVAIAITGAESRMPSSQSPTTNPLLDAQTGTSNSTVPDSKTLCYDCRRLTSYTSHTTNFTLQSENGRISTKVCLFGLSGNRIR